MVRFEDYHRTIVGYHGTRLSVALDIVNRRKNFEYKRNKNDWLGHGIYFWEYAPRQAFWWAQRMERLALKQKKPWGEPIAIVGSMIRLGSCLDLLEPDNIKYTKKICEKYRSTQEQLGLPIPVNAQHKRLLDCAIFEYLYAALEQESAGSARAIDSARAVYVPTDEKKRVWPGSWIYDESHIQVCVRNPSCILGSWLHHPSDRSAQDGTETGETPPIVGELDAPTGGQETGNDVP